MQPASRRRYVRSALVLALMVGGAAAVAQLAGVTGTLNQGNSSQLVFGEHAQQWLVQLPVQASSSTNQHAMSKAAGELGGGSVGTADLPGGWHEVRLDSDVSSDQAEAAFAAQGATDVEPVVPRVVYDLNQPGSASDPVSATTTRSNDPNDQPDVVNDPPAAFASHGTFGDRLRAGTMNATRLNEQWALDQPSDIDIDGTEAWQASTGAGVTVATIDTGADASHPDLRGRVLDGVDFSKSSTGATHDAVGHGTHVASIIAGGGITMAGVAPDAKILPLKVFRDSESAFEMDGYLKAITYAVDAGAKVINISLGCNGDGCYSQAEYDAISYANQHGVLVVVAAGNGDAAGRGMNNDGANTPDYPSDYDLPNIVSVTSSTKLGGWSTWANYGAHNVDLAAPGESILAATPGTGYTTVTGTSFSAPMVSGALALLAAADPTASGDDLKARLLAGVDTTGDLQARTVSGGTLNANTALRSATPIVADAGVTTLQQVAPANKASVKTPPTMTWRLPAAWKSVRVEVRGGGATYSITTAPTRRALAHPTGGWRAGTYTWRVLATNASGAVVKSPWRSYVLQPRVNAWITSGRLARDGRSLQLRIEYGAMASVATTKIRITSGARTVFSGGAQRHTEHVHGGGFPHRGSFTYTAKLGSTVRSGSTVLVYVTVTSGGASHTYSFPARVK